MERKARRVPFVWAVFAIALVLRLIPVLATPDLGIGLDDMFQYDMLGRSIASGNGYRWYAQDDLQLAQRYTDVDLATADYDQRGVLTSFRAPLYPAFLASIYTLPGVGARRFLAVRLAQALLGALLVPMTFFTAQRVFPSRPRVARWSAVALAFYPIMIVYPLTLTSENLFFVLVMAATLALLKASESQDFRWFALAGALVGLASLTRSVFLLAGVAAVFWVLFALKNRRGALLMAATLLIVCLPWIARNSMLHGRLVGIENSAGYNLYVGYHPRSTGTFQYGISLDLLPIVDDARRDEIGTAKALAFIRNDPARVPALALMRLGHFFGLEKRGLMYFYSGNVFGHIATPALLALALLFLLPFVIASTSALFGLALAEWRRPEVALLGVILAGYLLPHVLIIAEDRFHLAILPLALILAARCWDGGIRELRQAWKSQDSRRALVLVAGLGVALLLFNWGYELHRDADKLALILGSDGNHAELTY